MKSNTSKKSLEPLLSALGFTDKETDIYMLLLKLGEAPAATIITQTKLKRGIVYAALASLEKLQLITTQTKDKKTYFRIEHPSQLLRVTKQKVEEAQVLSAGLQKLLPDLSSQYKLAVGKPTIQYFEGEEGIKEVFEDIYAPKDDIVWGAVDFEASDEAVPSYIVDKLIPKRIKNKLWAYSFFADSPQSRKLKGVDRKSYRKCILVDKKKYPLPAEIDVYEDKVAMLSFEKGEFIGLLIENKAFAQTLRSIFKLAFDARWDKKD
ncbi:MAG: TrmB family transcriptional regulator [Weeksellaceae bacterium]